MRHPKMNMNQLKLKTDQTKLVELAFSMVDDIIIEELKKKFGMNMIFDSCSPETALIRTGEMNVINYLEQRIGKARENG